MPFITFTARNTHFLTELFDWILHCNTRRSPNDTINKHSPKRWCFVFGVWQALYTMNPASKLGHRCRHLFKSTTSISSSGPETTCSCEKKRCNFSPEHRTHTVRMTKIWYYKYDTAPSLLSRLGPIWSSLFSKWTIIWTIGSLIITKCWKTSWI